MYKMPKNPNTVKATVFSGSCPARLLINRISGKWSLLIIDLLGNKRLRNAQILRSIEGISQRVLTRTLRDLEEINIIARFDMQSVPPHVEYSLTDKGLSLRKKICALDRWIENNMLELVDNVKEIQRY